jgi:hypothetical protein
MGQATARTGRRSQGQGGGTPAPTGRIPGLKDLEGWQRTEKYRRRDFAVGEVPGGMQATARAAAGRRRQRQSRRRDHRASAAVAVEGAKGKPLFLLSFAIIYSIFFLFLDCDFVNFFVRHT